MGSAEGAARAAAVRIGVPYDQYVAEREAGRRWCIGCRRFIALAAFPPSRRDTGKRDVCVGCRHEQRKGGCQPKNATVVFPLIPVTFRRSDAACIGALVLATGVDPWRLRWLPVMDVEELCALTGLTREELDRAVWARWLRSTTNGTVYGVGIAAGDVFGAGEVVEMEEAA